MDHFDFPCSTYWQTLKLAKTIVFFERHHGIYGKGTLRFPKKEEPCHSFTQDSVDILCEAECVRPDEEDMDQLLRILE